MPLGYLTAEVSSVLGISAADIRKMSFCSHGKSCCLVVTQVSVASCLKLFSYQKIAYRIQTLGSVFIIL